MTRDGAPGAAAASALREAAARPVRADGAVYWDEMIERVRASRPLDVWYRYMREVYGRLAEEWLPPAARARALKTDLFEEAVSAHHPLADLGPESLGVDLSLNAVRLARRRLGDGRASRCMVADLRSLPLLDGALAGILSGSSLDHFEHAGDLRTALGELARILAPGGALVLTLDNPHNPVVWLRNRLPFGLLAMIGVVPYYVGRTLGREEALRELAAAGLEVRETRAVAHAPRAPALWLVRLAARLGRGGAVLGRLLSGCERLARWPSRYRTGYYLAFLAVKPLPDARGRGISRGEPETAPERAAARSAGSGG